jgi:hypothetical protein
MIQCPNCGESNTRESQFCRYCGVRMAAGYPEDYSQSPPRPYAWKTDEYETKTGRRSRGTAANLEIPRQQAYPVPNAMQYPVVYHGPQDLSGNYRCRYCGTNYLPVMERRISTAGWITFSLLLVFTIVFFWIGLLIKEDVPICPVCRQRVY